MKKILAVSLLLVTSMASAETCKLQTYASSWMATAPLPFPSPARRVFIPAFWSPRPRVASSVAAISSSSSISPSPCSQKIRRTKEKFRPAAADRLPTCSWMAASASAPKTSPTASPAQSSNPGTRFQFRLSRSPSSPPAATSTSSPASSLKSSQSADEPVLPAFPPPPLPLPNNTDPLTSAPRHFIPKQPAVSYSRLSTRFFPLT